MFDSFELSKKISWNFASILPDSKHALLILVFLNLSSTVTFAAFTQCCHPDDTILNFFLIYTKGLSSFPNHRVNTQEQDLVFLKKLKRGVFGAGNSGC